MNHAFGGKDNNERMNVVDVLAVVIIVFSTITAMMKGFVSELFWIASIIIGFLVAAHFYSEFAYRLLESGVGPIASGFLSFIGLFVAVMVVGAVAGGFVGRVVRTMRLKWVDRLLGGAVGFIKGVLIVTVVFLALTAFPIRQDLMTGSTLAPYFLTTGNLLVKLCPQDFRRIFNETYDRLYRIWLEQDLQPEDSQ